MDVNAAQRKSKGNARREKIMVLKKVGSYWILYSRKTHRILGKFKRKRDALKRERQIQYFKKRR